MRKTVLAATLALMAGHALGQGAGDLSYRLDLLDAELQAIRAQIGGSAAGVVTGGSLDIARLEAEIARLTNEVEQLRFKLDRIAADAAQRFGDIEFRLTELEGGDITALGPTVPLGESGGGGVASGGTGTQIAISERRDLDTAIADIQSGRYDQADERLRRFMLDYPGSPLTGEAQFWRGEGLFIRGYYQDAARAFLASYQDDSVGTHAARSLQRLGASLGRLGQLADACSTLREVPRQYPTAQPEVLDEAAAEAVRLNCG